MDNNNIVWHNGFITRDYRNLLNRHKSGLLWLTGLPASGKSTVAHCIEKELMRQNVRAYVLDGDNLRHNLNSDLGFSREDRKENLRRVAEVSKLFVDAGMIVIAAFISPYAEDRAFVRSIVGGQDFFEGYIKCSLEECERRDPKGHYKKARSGIIRNYTGISAPYEEPENPDIVVDTERDNLECSVRTVLDFLDKAGLTAISAVGI
ncbi:MAG: adenylyl-sulfate kinase [Thermodesulfovibrionales bacterium]|jgi:adenylylsulfate kinase